MPYQRKKLRISRIYLRFYRPFTDSSLGINAIFCVIWFCRQKIFQLTRCRFWRIFISGEEINWSALRLNYANAFLKPEFWIRLVRLKARLLSLLWPRTDGDDENQICLPIGYIGRRICRPVFWTAGDILAAGEQGEIVVTGPAVSKGYINNPEKTEQSFFELEVESLPYRWLGLTWRDWHAPLLVGWPNQAQWLSDWVRGSRTCLESLSICGFCRRSPTL